MSAEAFLGAVSAGNTGAVKQLLLQHGKHLASARDKYGQTAAFMAASKGFREVLDVLVDMCGVGIFSDTDNQGQTPIFAAILSRQELTVEYLIRKGSNMQHMDTVGRMPLHIAVAKGHIGIVKIVCAHSDSIAIEHADVGNMTPLKTAAMKGFADIVVHLVQVGKARVNPRLMLSTDSPLNLACHYGHFQLVKWLIIEAGAEVEKETGEWPLGNNALAQASLGGHSVIVDWLLRHCSFKPQSLSVALCLACKSGHLAVVEILVGHGVPLNSVAHGKTPLAYACRSGHLKIVSFLVKHGANPAQEQPESAYHIAATAGSLEVLKWLVEEAAQESRRRMSWRRFTVTKKSQVDKAIMEVLMIPHERSRSSASDKTGQLPLHAAAANGHLKIVQWMVSECGMDVDTPTLARKRTALHFACLNQHEALVEWLIEEANADPFALDDGLCSPLHYAAQSGNLRIVQLLLAYGSQQSKRDEKNRTPLGIAHFYDRQEVTLYLQRTRSWSAMQIAVDARLHHIVSNMLKKGQYDPKLIEPETPSVLEIAENTAFRPVCPKTLALAQAALEPWSPRNCELYGPTFRRAIFIMFLVFERFQREGSLLFLPMEMWLKVLSFLDRSQFVRF